MSRHGVVALLLLASCAEEEVPAVTGTLELLPPSSTDGYSFVAIRFFTAGPSWFGIWGNDVPLPATWPMPFAAGDLDESSGPRVVRAWLAREKLEPAAGDAPWGQKEVTLSCADRCEPITGVELILYPH
jgi:hypothetical protein